MWLKGEGYGGERGKAMVRKGGGLWVGKGGELRVGKCGELRVGKERLWAEKGGGLSYGWEKGEVYGG